MPFKVKSEQIQTDRYVYQCVQGHNEFWFEKARPKEVLIIQLVAIFNRQADVSGLVYKVMKRKGVTYYLNSNAGIAAVSVVRWGVDVYLIDGDEMGVIITPNATGDEFDVVCQFIRMRDDEYFKAT